MRSSESLPGPGRFVWERVVGRHDARIQPLDAGTVEQASRARVWVDGAIAAYLQRSGERWDLSLPDQPGHIESSGSTAITVVSNWLAPSEENLP